MKTSRVFALVFLGLTFIGLLDATYLTVQHYLSSVPPCFVVSGCETVLTSKWNQIFGLPVALLGGIYYLILGLLTVAHLKSKNEHLMIVAAFTTALGLLATIWFVCLQFFVLEEICSYCMISATTSTGLFLAGLFLLNSNRDYVIQKFAERKARYRKSLGEKRSGGQTGQGVNF